MGPAWPAVSERRAGRFKRSYRRLPATPAGRASVSKGDPAGVFPFEDDRTNFDINAAQANLDRWDLDLTIDGETHPVREVTLQEFADLVNREALTPDEQLDTLAGLFHKTAPPVRDWSRDKRDVVFTAIGAYLNEHLEKKLGRQN